MCELELDEHGLPTGKERRRAAYTIALVPRDIQLNFIREIGRQIGYEVTRKVAPEKPPKKI